MDVSNVVKSRKRYASNVMWLTRMFEYMKAQIGQGGNLGNTTADAIITAWYNQLRSDLNDDVVKKYLQITWNHELIEFHNTVYDSTSGNFDENLLKKQLEFEILCLPSETRTIAKIPDPDPNNAAYAEWSKIFGIMYMTRKFVAIAEGICVDKRMPGFMSPDDIVAYNELWELCIRIRSSTFSSLAPGLDDRPAQVKAEDIVKYYETWGEEAGAPFYGNRRKRLKPPEQMHRDDPLLSSWAGTHRVPVDTGKSVMGLIEKVFNLPERCDISGTTTDTIGYALWTVDIQTRGTDPDIFTFVNIFAMILSGHHSLFETVSAASLWSLKYYEPFYPLSIFDVLGNVFCEDGSRQVRKLKHLSDAAYADASLNSLYNYITSLWQDLSGSLIAGVRSKEKYVRALEITQPVYVLAQQLNDERQK